MSGSQRARRVRLLGSAISVAAHLGLLVLLLLALRSPLNPAEPDAIVVQLVDGRRPVPAASHPTPAAKPTPVKALARQSIARPSPAPVPPDIVPIAAGDAPVAESGDALSDAELAGATSADAGPSGRQCDMARWLQGALRKDPLVQAAVAGSAGRAIMVWNGDWVRSNGEDGKGLAAVREAIIWEIAFAPEACRAEPVHGLVLLSMGQARGSARLAVGLGEWRWADLLKLRPAG